jgi:hypothetical protein
VGLEDDSPVCVIDWYQVDATSHTPGIANIESGVIDRGPVYLRHRSAQVLPSMHLTIMVSTVAKLDKSSQAIISILQFQQSGMFFFDRLALPNELVGGFSHVQRHMHT